jgi:hypothetical protein
MPATQTVKRIKPLPHYLSDKKINGWAAMEIFAANAIEFVALGLGVALLLLRVKHAENPEGRSAIPAAPPPPESTTVSRRRS